MQCLSRSSSRDSEHHLGPVSMQAIVSELSVYRPALQFWDTQNTLDAEALLKFVVRILLILRREYMLCHLFTLGQRPIESSL